jgi:hypothetical protein
MAKTYTRTPLPLHKRLERVTPLFHSFYIEEPRLVFAGGNLSVDPKGGLEAYGPYGAEREGTKTIQIGVVGTATGIQDFANFLNTCQTPIKAGFNKRNKPLDPHTHPDFPGCDAAHTFRSRFASEHKAFQRTIHPEFFSQALRASDAEAKIRDVVSLLVVELEALNNLDPAPDVIVVLLPPDAEHEIAHVGAAMTRRKIPMSAKERFLARLKRDETSGQGLLTLSFDEDRPTEHVGFWNIHHAFKAHAMRFDIPTQLMWESTLRNEQLSSAAWNLFTALYYKAGNTPWRLQLLPDNTCYVGVSFYKERPYGRSDIRSSLAQVFGAGEGIVLQGGKAVINKERGDASPHLTERESEELLRNAISKYTLQHHTPPTRIVLHKTSRYWPEELAGFRKALDSIYHYDFLAFGDLNTRFMRVGKRPVLRGTVIMLGKRNYVLFTSGYIPYLRSYPSKRIPRPLEIIEHYGDSTAATVCSEILSLTKLNWNSCWFGSSMPITIRFSRDVGRVLAEIPSDGSISPQSKYRYYM